MMRRMFGVPSLIGKSREATPISPDISLSERERFPLVAKPERSAPSQFFRATLKSEEHKRFPAKKRQRTDYQDNVSAALSMSYSVSELIMRQRNQARLLAIASPNIIEHANRRVDLFFYTLIAYYSKQVHPIIGHTSLQHGRGRHATPELIITQGCHSSFTPSLVDETIYQSRTVKRRKSLLSGTHFMHSLNSTVELPSFVNEFDDLLESSCRPRSVEILTEVSTGIIDPIEGLRLFLIKMEEVLNELQLKVVHQSSLSASTHSLLTHRPVNLKLISLIKQGTLSMTFLSDTKTVADDYIQLLLRLTEPEKESCRAGEELKEKIYVTGIIKMQEEILSSPSSRLMAI